MVNIICRYILLYFIIISGSLAISYKFKKRICQTLPVAFFSIMIILYIFGLLQCLKIGVYLITFIYPILFLICIIHSSIKKNLKEFFKNYIVTPDVLIFTLLFSAFGVSTYNRIFTACDDYGYWSMAVKNMFYLDDFVTNSNSIIRLVYPPFPTILQYFFEKVIGENRQGIELFATILFGLSLLLPLLKNLKPKRIISLICISGVILAIPAIFIESWFYFTIYVDSLLGLLIGYVLFEYYTSSKDTFSILSLILGISVLTLTKPTGFFISLIIMGIIGLDYIFNLFNKNLKSFIKSLFNLKNLKIIIILFVAILIAYSSWTIYKSKVPTDIENKSNKQESSISYVVQTIWSTFTGNSQNTKDVTSFVNLLTDLFDKNTYSSKPFGMSAGTWISLFVILSILLYKFVYKDDDKKRFIKYMSSIFIGTFVYICFLQVAYVIEFPDIEAVSHASIERYLGTFLMAILIVLIGIFIDYNNKKENYSCSTYVLILAVVLIFTPITPISNITIASGAFNNSIKSDAQKIINRK